MVEAPPQQIAENRMNDTDEQLKRVAPRIPPWMTVC